MKRALVALVAVAALAIGTGSAFADPTPPPGNSSNQQATLGQSASSTSVASNSGVEGSASSEAVASNHAGISQFAGQAADNGNNTSSQGADVQQGASAIAVAVNDTYYGGHASAEAKAKNDAFVDQDAWQLALDGTANSSTQGAGGSQEADAFALASNSAPCGGCADSFAGSFNHGWINQLAVQLAFP